MNWLNFSEPSLRGNCSGLTCGIKTCISVSCPNNGGCAWRWCWNKSCYINLLTIGKEHMNMNWLKDYNEIKPRGACVIRVCTQYNGCNPLYWCWRLEGN